LTLEDGTEGLSRNIGKQSPTYAAQTQKIKGLIYKQWKPEILQLSPDFEQLTALHFLHNI
jgi:hypothetical protein